MIELAPQEMTDEQQVGKKGFRLFTFLKEFKGELIRVSWTTKKELKFFTQLVVAATFLFGMGIYLADLMIKGCLQLVNRLAYFIFG